MPLEYPFKIAPSKTSLVEIAPTIKWLRQPLPMTLDHINCYLIRDGEGWCVVDTGMNTDIARKQWLDIFEGSLDNGKITRVIATHHHPDHIGLAGFLCDEFKVPLWTTEAEYFYARTFTARSRDTLYWEVDTYLNNTCMSESTRSTLFTGNNKGFGEIVSTVPGSYHRVCDQEILQIGEHQWKAITTRGHSPEHLSLYCPALNLLLSGDQVLPKITSNVCVSPTEPEANPLVDWINAHEKIKEQVPDSVLVLPSHQLPFKGLHQRLDQVVAHHEDRLEQIKALCITPQNAQAITSQIFKRVFDPFQNFLAVGEVVAHLHLLMERGDIIRLLSQGQDQSHYSYKAIHRDSE